MKRKIAVVAGAPEGAAFFSGDRSKLPGELVCSGTMVCTVATRPVVAWTENERSWSVLVGRIAEGNEHALTEFYDCTNPGRSAARDRTGLFLGTD